MLGITWREGPEYPMGIQDSALGVVEGKVVSAGGFTRWPKEIVKTYPDAFGGAESGFTSLSFSFDPTNEDAGWTRMPDVPGPARQGSIPAVVGDEMYVFGGFNYTAPHTYREGYRLRRNQGQWGWERLSCDFPWPIYGAGVAVVGKRIYFVGGADYFRTSGAKNEDFHSEAGRDGDPVGRAVFMLDTEDLQAGWRRLADLPGTPRMTMGCGAIGGRIYVLGGTFGALKPGPYCNVVDSWAYDIAEGTWSQLEDMPDGANRSAVAFGDRYVILIGGYKYSITRHPDGSQGNAYTDAEKAQDWKAAFQGTVLVYDTKRDELATADPLLDETSWPMVAIKVDTAFVLGGEGGRGLWHPATFQIGKIAEGGDH